jgi:hypothetical protein
MSYFSSLPPAEPMLVPMGTYQASLAGEASEQTSRFKGKDGKEKTYWALPLTLRNTAGEEFSFLWCFGSKAPLYLKFLEIMGGRTTPSGRVNPPLDNTENSFMIKLGEKQNREKTKLVNEVLDVWTDNRKAVAAKELASKAADAEIEDSIPF